MFFFIKFFFYLPSFYCLKTFALLKRRKYELLNNIMGNIIIFPFFETCDNIRIMVLLKCNSLTA